MWVIRESWFWASGNINSPLVKTQSACVHERSVCNRQGRPITTHVGFQICIYAHAKHYKIPQTQLLRQRFPRTLHNFSFIKLKTETLSTFKLNSCYELRLQSIEGLMFLAFINYCNTSAVFFFIDDSCFSDEVQCIKSKRPTVSDGLTVGLGMYTGQRKQPMCSNAVSLFPVIAIIICQHPEVGWMLCSGILKNLLFLHTQTIKKSLAHNKLSGRKYIK